MVVMAIVTTCMTTPVVIWLYPESYQRQRARELGGGDVDSKYQLDLSQQQEPKQETYRLMVTLNKLQTVPAMMILIQMLQQDARSERRLRKSLQHPDRWPITQLEVHTLRILELSQRSSAVMKIQDTHFLQNDPVLSVFRTFAQLTGIKLTDDINISTPSEFAPVVTGHAQDAKSDIVILPWTFMSRTDATEGSSNDLAITNGSDERDAPFIRRVLETSHTTVGILVDRGYTKTAYTKTIVVPFLGGVDDREALKFALRMQASSAQILIVRFIKNDSTAMEDPQEGRKYSPSRNPSVRSIQTYLQEIDAVASDDTLFETLVNDGIISGGQLTHEAIPEHEEHVDTIPKYQKMQLTKINAQLIQVVQDLEEGDMVIVGRRRLNADHGDLESGASELGKALGGVAQILMSTKASLLVIQASAVVNETPA